ncbi:MAG: carbohydrate ABC transporter permease [Firmicutes bacterium]|jgi:sn-glycerol 3-phosphate transport system permease protein|nr:carbohydrate ABC transporter permease [Bacillota bacterium]
MNINVYKVRRIVGKILMHGLMITLSFLVLMPLLLGLSVSLQTRTQVFSYPPSFVPSTLYFGNYADAWRLGNLGRLLLNSLLASSIVMLGKLITGVTSGYAFSHFEFKGKGFFFIAVIITLMLPMQIMVVPLFELVSRLGSANRLSGLVFPFLASATTTFLLRQHFLTIPKELLEAAQIDGCGPIKFLLQILIPLSGPSLAGLATINFLTMWNAYLWPLVVINSDKQKVIQQGVKMMFASATEREWGIIMAATITAVIPPLLVFLLSQRFFVQGIATQGIKE